MGTYLSTPVLDKHSEDGCEIQTDNNNETPAVRWAVVDMQGWRKSMEDAHVARTDVTLPSCYLRKKKTDGGHGSGDGETFESKESTTGDNDVTSEEAATHAKVFAVFDGHGGAEVARFCQINLVPVLTSQVHWKEFEEGENEGEGEPVANGQAAGDEDEEDEKDNNNDNMASYIGQALISSFHALDRLIDDPNSRSEIDKWRIERPPPYMQGGENYVYDNNIHDRNMGLSSSKAEEEKELETEEAEGNPTVESESEEELDMDEVQHRRHTVMDPSEIADDGAKLHLIDNGESEDSDEEESGTEVVTAAKEDTVEGEGEEKKNGEVGTIENKAATLNGNCHATANLLDAANDEDEDGDVFEDSISEEDQIVAAPDEADSGDLENEAADGVVHDDSDTDEKEEEQTNKNDDDDDGEVEQKKQGTMVLSANDAVALFQKLLRGNGTDENDEDSDEDEVDVVKVNGDTSAGGSAPESEVTGGGAVVIPTKEALLNPPTGIVAPSVSVPTRIQNGRKICNLPDHPVHAGCTSVVAVIVGRTLVVANAGDSRAVVCRAGGLTEPLSFDHKPLQNREMNRITNAGGFVNQFGRVNGNLNLSRSIGDLKYKQVPGIPPPEQMITAEPDILSTTLKTGDEFIVLGCDGIWDCLTNEECVKYVHDRIDSKTPTEIGKEMLDEIVSADPRASQGIGGDNMTIMIVDLLPSTRPYSNTR